MGGIVPFICPVYLIIAIRFSMGFIAQARMRTKGSDTPLTRTPSEREA